jgi:CDP-diacylglycerol--glycerol-3-phosphate 3-phosphatidyltransferase
MGLVPVILFLAWHQDDQWFIPVLTLAIVTDALDGPLARARNQCSPLGRALDSWADFALYMATPLIFWWYAPDLAHQELPFFLLGAGAFTAPVLIGFLKYGRLTMYHAWSAKLMGWTMAIGGLILFMGHGSSLFHGAIFILVFSPVEEILITVLLPKWRADVPSVWHAWRYRNEMKP